MSDPLSIAASVIALLQLTATATQYLKDVKHGSADRLRLRDELRSTACLLEMLKDRVEDADDASETEETLKPGSIRALAEPDGPLSLFGQILQEIITKLEPQASLRRLAKPFTWPFDKKDISEMLNSLERLKSHFSLIMQNDLRELAKLSNLKLNDLNDKADRSEAKSRDEEAIKIISWISPISFHAKHIDILERVEPGTGTWLIEHDTVQGWLRGDINVLWCPGIPGAGKTSLVSLIINRLEQERAADITCAYVYCDYNQRLEQTPYALLSSLLQQVLRNFADQPLPADVSVLYSQHQKYGTRPTQTQITEILQKLAAKLATFYIVVDALDECGESEEDALQFMEIVSSLGARVKVLYTSRFSTTFEEHFSQSEKLQISAQNADITTFLDAQIRQKYRLSRHVRADPKLKDEIVETIIQESQGMFLLAKLHLESLSQKINRKEVRISLKTLPASLNATYSEALDRIYRQAPEAVELAEAVLFWVLCAKRSLTILELQQIYATQDLPEDAGLEEDDLPDADILTGVCGGLIMVDSDSRTVRLVHYTAQQYFEQFHSQKLTQARISITNISLKYLALPNFSSGICTTDKAMAQRLEEYPFLDYAAKHWGAEINIFDQDGHVPAFDKLASSTTALGTTSQAFGIPSDRHSNWSQEFPRDIPALVLAATFDLPRVLERMVRTGHDLESKGTDEDTALIRAASFGHQENARVLLHLGADKNARDHMNETALQRAAGNGEADVIKVLLEKEADVNVSTSSDWTALMAAVSSGNIEAVQMLVDAGANLMAETVWGDSALSIATRNGQEAIATLLADRGAILPHGPAGRRASTVASRRGFLQLVRRLTADYEAVASQPLQRQSLRIMGGLSHIGEVDEPARAEEEASSAEIPEPDQGDFSEATEGLDYNMGFSRRYDLKESIGKGHFAEVFSCTNRVTGLVYAAKVWKIERWIKASTKIEGIHSESHTLQRAQKHSQANILRIVDLFAEYAEAKVYMVLELAPEGELFNFIVMKQRLTEAEARKILQQIFSALEFLHGLGLAHRDIKPENILLFDKECLHIKLADFGLTKNIGCEPDSVELATTLCGTPSYVAPEVLEDRAQRRYGLGVDVWSAGVVLYICLCGFPPFSDELYSEAFPYTLSQQIRSGRFDYPSPYWDPIGDPALDLIDSMLVVNAEKRFSVKQCISHAWTVDASTSILQDVIRSASPEPM
ncbi:Ff.00g024960.m01.CDS01 [Fusarium sp. VM40]|nr:Ff.00g024960.m01.CDS01 [Fusarium sp. VM40]